MDERKRGDVAVPAIGRGMGGRPGGLMGGPMGGGPMGGPMARFAPGEKAKDAKGTFRKLLRFYLKEGKSLFVVAVLLIAETALSVSVPYLVGRSVGAMADGLGFGAVDSFAAILVAAYSANWAIGIVHGLIMTGASQRIVKDLRNAMFDKFQTLPLAFHDTHTHGELMSRLTNDVDNISSTIAQSTTQLISAAIMVVGSFSVMLYLNAYLALTALITVPLVILLTKAVSGRSRRLFKAQQRELGKLNGMIEESIAGHRIVQAFSMEGKVVESFGETNERLRRNAVLAQIWSGVLMPFMNVVTNLGYVAIAAVGGTLVYRGLASVGVIASFTAYSRQFTFPLNNIAGMFNNLQSALAGAERVFEILGEEGEGPDPEGAAEMTDPKGDVRFEHVTFSYVEGVKVLDDVSFEVRAGSKVALVGPTGAGKTTIVNLLTRFYDASEGAIYLDGTDIRKYRRDSLRTAFSVVLQDTCLFTGTIADNIRYGKPEATDGEVVEAATLAGADAFIRRLRGGYGTEVSGQSDNLSQGERQLLAIARAVLCKAPILVLDEATSSVDTRTELSIQRALLRLASGRTSFVIAHRLSTIRDADVIMVVQGGRIVESGSHRELLALGGEYAKMHESQM
ncbi:MAG: ABC transporter ATP-binding protein/permease [Oscillospiraceae bacterium]|nr:ABC transporter ATP-binding protein/permease [Oscillospiraceae bacterium]